MFPEARHLYGAFSTHFVVWNLRFCSVNGYTLFPSLRKYSRLMVLLGSFLCIPLFLLLFRLLIYLLENESHILNWTSDVVEEGRTSCDEDLCPAAGQSSLSYRFLAFSVLKLWARLMRGNVQWAMIKIIGEGLDMYADTCRNEQNPL